MANKKIFTDQQEIAIKLVQINNKSKEEFIDEYERIYGKIRIATRFPNVIQIYDKYSIYYKNKDGKEQITPKKVNAKAEKIEKNRSSFKNLEETKIPCDLTNSETKPKIMKQENLNQKAQIDIENKIQKANITASRQENKREGSGSNKRRTKAVMSYSKIGKCETMDPQMFAHIHQNPHMQIGSRGREGEDKRAISSSRDNPYMMPAHSPSARQPTTVEKYTLFGFSEDSTI